MTTNALRAAAARGTLFGAWLTFADSYALEALGPVGFDWVGIDAQHGNIGGADLPALLRTCDLMGLPGLVRTAGHGTADIGRALDAGAAGVIVPMVESAEQAAHIAAACRVPPRGVRSSGASRESFRASAAGEDVLCLPMVESAAGLAHAEAIAAVDGVDGIFVGPYDLSLSIGAPGGAAGPATLAAIDAALSAARGLGKMTGLYSGNPRLAALAGVHLLAVDSDLAFLRAGAAAALAAAKD
ncbi:HpcH/HpaI aldolase family protein [Specibacter cremeus]|uniref:HpcH/HpaI aldolase family protein n=1 Tax=Specibacter cremeus TaxID=1629051 RepID=UPI0013DDD0E3|nr:aldolase/citrate lyase family protein [Specibacter cremeus]